MKPEVGFEYKKTYNNNNSNKTFIQVEVAGENQMADVVYSTDPLMGLYQDHSDIRREAANYASDIRRESAINTAEILKEGVKSEAHILQDAGKNTNELLNEETLIHMADDMASAATTFNSGGYEQFLQAREKFKDALHRYVSKI